MSHGFVCVGGPYDGKWMPQQPGQDRFNVALWPGPSTVEFSAENAPVPTENLVVRHGLYVLEEHVIHGAAWVFKAPT